MIDKNISNINDKFQDPKAAGTQVDLASFNNAKNDLAAITDTYKNCQKELEAAQKASLLSEEDYLLRRQALIGNQLDQTTAAYEAEIAALEATKGQKTMSGEEAIMPLSRLWVSLALYKCNGYKPVHRGGHIRHEETRTTLAFTLAPIRRCLAKIQMFSAQARSCCTICTEGRRKLSSSVVLGMTERA